MSATLTPPATTPISVFADQGAWATYSITLQLTGQLIGGQPSDPKLVEAWLSKNIGIPGEEEMKERVRQHLIEIGTVGVEATDDEVKEAIEKAAHEIKAQVFKRTSEGEPYIEGRHLKAMIKEATNIGFPKGSVKWGQRQDRRTTAKVGDMAGGKPPIAFVAERVFVDEKPYVVGTAADVTRELAVGHVERNGQQYSTIGFHEAIDRPVLEFEVRVLDDCISEEQWARIWTIAEANGLGARRSQGAGQFVVTKWERQ